MPVLSFGGEGEEEGEFVPRKRNGLRRNCPLSIGDQSREKGEKKGVGNLREKGGESVRPSNVSIYP